MSKTSATSAASKAKETLGKVGAKTTPVSAPAPEQMSPDKLVVLIREKHNSILAAARRSATEMKEVGEWVEMLFDQRTDVWREYLTAKIPEISFETLERYRRLARDWELAKEVLKTEDLAGHAAETILKAVRKLKGAEGSRKKRDPEITEEMTAQLLALAGDYDVTGEAQGLLFFLSIFVSKAAIIKVLKKINSDPDDEDEPDETNEEEADEEGDA